MTAANLKSNIKQDSPNSSSRAERKRRAVTAGIADATKPRGATKARIGKHQALAATEQDRMYRVERVWDRAVNVLADEEAARAWINRENRSLGGESPLSLLDTEAGYELVLDTLGRIETGSVA